MLPARDHVLTAIVGSYPKPRYIYPRGGRALLDSFGFAFDRRREEVGAAEFARLLEDPATADAASDRYCTGATRVQFMLKDPRGWKEFADQFRALSRKGRAMTLRHIVAARPSVLDFEEEYHKMRVPVLLITGDEDEQTLMPGVFMKKHIPTAGFCVLPRIGYTLNLEEPGLFNQMLYDFISSIELGTWKPRDPRSMATKEYLVGQKPGG